MTRQQDLTQFYELLHLLEQSAGGLQRFDSMFGRKPWPERGVYFFFEANEFRRDSGQGLRVTRVGTHGLSTGSKSTLRGRLSQHFGQIKSGAGNHRGSIFRLLVGDALIQSQEVKPEESWGVGASHGNAAAKLGKSTEWIKEQERPLEVKVSSLIRSMPFLCLPIDDQPGPDSLRGYVERNAIGLLSNHNRPALDPPSSNWLGSSSSRDRVRLSGLWNNNHVEGGYDTDFIPRFASLIGDLFLLGKKQNFPLVQDDGK